MCADSTAWHLRCYGYGWCLCIFAIRIFAMELCKLLDKSMLHLHALNAREYVCMDVHT